MVLVGQLGAQQSRLLRRQVGQYDRHGLVPPGQAAQIRLIGLEIARRQVHARQHGTHRRAVHRPGCQLAAATQLVHDRRRLAGDQVQQAAVVARARVGHRVWHRNAVVRQVLHQLEVER